MTSSLPERGERISSIMERRRLLKAFIRRFFLGAVVVTCLATFSAAQSAPPVSELITLSVSHRADLGANGFDIRISGDLDFLFGVSVTAPDGTVFKNYGPGTPLMSIGSLTLNQITARFAGEWIINDARNLPPGVPTQHHRFSLSALDLSTFPLTTPQIVSPPDGALLPAEFDVVRTGSGGVSLSGDNIRYGINGTHVDLSFRGRHLPEVVEARTWSSVSISINATPLDASPVRQFRIPVFKSNLSTPVTWTIGVPEPSSAAMVSLAMVGVAAFRRLKQPRRLPAASRNSSYESAGS